MLPNNKLLYICCLYRPPGTGQEPIKNLNSNLSNINPNNDPINVIIAGDFNCPGIDWTNNTIKTHSTEKETHETLLEFLEEHFLTQVQHKPSRQTNCLDLLITSNPSKLKSITLAPGLSDHDMIIADMDIQPSINKPAPRKIYKFNKANWENIKIDTLVFQLQYLSQEKDNSIETNWNNIKTHLHLMADKHVPHKMSSTRTNLPWFNQHLKKLVKKKQRLYNKAKKDNTPTNWESFRSFQKLTKKAIKSSYWQYINNTLTKSLEDGNVKPFWKYIKSKKQDASGVAPLKSGGILHSEANAKANILNNQFQSVFSIDIPSPLPKPPDTIYPIIDKLQINNVGIIKLLKNLNISKAAGPDGIQNTLLKELHQELAPIITNFFNRSLSTGQLPEDWRNANITPIFKKGDKQDPANYRPVSLTCILTKLLEHIIVKHLLDHFEKNNILTNLQHGFRSGYSCETQLLNTIDDLAEAYDNNIQIDIAILDFSKAFDVVSHRKLLAKLENYGVTGNLNTWIANFLQDRSQCVLVEGIKSTSVRVASGVPQGTCLGPILFLTYINDIVEGINCQLRLFADDALLYTKINNHNDHYKIQKDLDTLENWAATWDMRFNPSKCYILSICKTEDPNFYHLYTLCNEILEHKKDNPYLGVLISQNLSFSKHIQTITSKANSILGLLNRNLKSCPTKLKQTAYITLVRSKLEYACPIWDPHLVKEVNLLERVQRRAARFVLCEYKRTASVTNLLSKLNWQNLQNRRCQARLVLLYKVFNKLVSGITPNKLETNTNRTRAGLSKCSFKIIPTKTTTYKHSFYPRTIRDWNNLPENTRNSEKITSFKSNIMKLPTKQD